MCRDRAQTYFWQHKSVSRFSCFTNVQILTPAISMQTMSSGIVVWLLNFPKNLLSVEHVGYEDPTGSSHEVLSEVLSVGLAVDHSPTEGEVRLKHFMAHVHKDGVHTRIIERRSWPPPFHIHCVVDQHEQHKRKAGQCCHIGQGP